jgi:hypothetical protein
VIKGELKGLRDSTMIYAKRGDGSVLATGKAAKGSFTLKGKMTDAEVLQVSFSNTPTTLDIFIGNENVTISGDIADPVTIKVKGSATETDYETFKKYSIRIFQNCRTLYP